VAVTSAGFAFFLDVRDFPTRRHFAVLADDAATGKRRKSKKPNETHHESSPLGMTVSNICTDELPFPLIHISANCVRPAA